MTRAELFEFMKSVSGHYRCAVPELEFYYEDLQEFSIEQLKSAFRLYRADESKCTYYPQPLDLIKNIARTQIKNEIYCAIDVGTGESCGKEIVTRYPSPMCVDHDEIYRLGYDEHIKLKERILEMKKKAKEMGVNVSHIVMQETPILRNIFKKSKKEHKPVNYFEDKK
jgi:hypothetical protein